MASLLRPVSHLLQMTVRLIRTRIGPVALCAVLPFVASHLVVMQARSIGMPERLVLDLLHDFIVLGYLTALVRVAGGEALSLARIGFAWPRGIKLPGLGVLVTMAAAVVIVGLPLALLLHPMVQALEGWQMDFGIYLPVTMLPEFVMTTLVGLVIAAQTGKVAP